MKKNTLFGLLLFSALVSNLSVKAQTDSTVLDLGRVKLKKDFTQTITIKGSDLQKMPFSDLSEAINVWFEGLYTAPVFIVDGILIADVNSYSIYDIESITLIQNSLGYIGGAPNGTKIIAITTKMQKENSSGLTFSAHPNVISRKATFREKEFRRTSYDYKTALYNQFYVSGYRNTTKTRLGLSANYLKDSYPNLSTNGKETLDRLRFRAYGDFNLGKSNLHVDLNNVPQKLKANEDFALDVRRSKSDLQQKTNIFNSRLSLSTAFSNHLKNDLDFSYNNYHGKLEGKSVAEQVFEVNSIVYNSYKKSNFNNSIFAIRDNFSVIAKAGKLEFEPAFNVNFKLLKSHEENINQLMFTSSFPGSDRNQNSTSDFQTIDKYFFLTPSLRLSYSQVFNLEGGLLCDLSKKEQQSDRDDFFPFVTSTIDLLRLFNPQSSSSIKASASYTKIPNIYGFTTSLSNFSYTLLLDEDEPSFYDLTSSGTYNSQKLDAYQWGIVVGLLNSRIQFAYNGNSDEGMFNRIYSSPQGVYRYQSKIKLTSHNLRTDINLLQKEKYSWHSAISLNNQKWSSKDKLIRTDDTKGI